MEYAFLGVLVLAILGSFYIAYMSSRTWPIYQTVLVVFLFLSAVSFFYLSARTLATHKAWRDLYRNQVNELASLESQLLPLQGGLDAGGNVVVGSVPTLRHDLAMATKARSGVYFDVTAGGIKEGVVALTLKSERHGLADNMTVYAFDQKPVAEGGRYLGEFRVTSAAPANPALQVVPALPLNAEQTKRLAAAASGTWTVYTTMPHDDPTVLGKLDDAARAALLPPEAAAEFAKLDRPLRDYTQFFHDNYVQKTLIADAISKTQSNIERIEKATAEAVKEAAFRDTEKTALQADLQGFRGEVTTIADYQKALEQKLSEVNQQLRTSYIEVRKAAADLTAEQTRAAEEVNRRTAQAG